MTKEIEYFDYDPSYHRANSRRLFYSFMFFGLVFLGLMTF